MKNILFFCFVVSTSLFLSAENDQELFLRAGKLYVQHKFDDAAQTYNRMKNKGRAAWYNLGNCNYAQNEYPQAVACWLRSKKGATRTERVDAHANISRVHTELGYPDERSALMVVVDYAKEVVAPFSYLVLQLVCLLCWIGAAYVFWASRTRRLHLIGLFLSLFACIATSLVYVAHIEQISDQAVVVADSAQVYAGPDKEFHQLDLISRAKIVAITDQQRRDWYKIRYSNCCGWIHAHDVTKV